MIETSEAIGHVTAAECRVPNTSVRKDFVDNIANRPSHLKFCMLFGLAQDTSNHELRAHIWRVAAIMLGSRHDLAKRTGYELAEPDSPDALNRQVVKSFQTRLMIRKVAGAYGLLPEYAAAICECQEIYGLWVQFSPTGESFGPDVQAAEQDAYKIMGLPAPTPDQRLRVVLD